MKQSSPHSEPDSWKRLARQAQQHQAGAPVDQDQAPFGFATRVVARAREEASTRKLAAMEHYWLRGVAFAGVLALGAVAFGVYEVMAYTELTSMAEVLPLGDLL